jgi:hypothetical protein
MICTQPNTFGLFCACFTVDSRFIEQWFRSNVSEELNRKVAFVLELFFVRDGSYELPDSAVSRDD